MPRAMMSTVSMHMPHASAEVERRARIVLATVPWERPEGSRGPKSKPPRLYNRSGWWYISFRGKIASTGLYESDRATAERVLARCIDHMRNGDALGLPVMLTDVSLADLRTHHNTHADPMSDNRRDAAVQRFRRCKATLERIIFYFGENLTLNRVGPDFAREYVAWRTANISFFRGKICREPRQVMPSKSVSVYTAIRDLECLERVMEEYNAFKPLSYVPDMLLRRPESIRKGVFDPGTMLRLLKALDGYVWDWDRGCWATETIKNDDGTTYTAEKRGSGPLDAFALKRAFRFFFIGLFTGTRHKCTATLQWRPHPTYGYIDVERMIIHRQGDNARTGKIRHSSPIAPFLQNHLRRWRDEDLGSDRPRVAIFHTRAGEPIEGLLSRDWAVLMTVAGIVPPPEMRDQTPVSCDADAVPHVLRHTVGTIFKQLGVPLAAAAAYTGMSERTLRRIYGQCSLVDGMPAALALNRLPELDSLHGLPDEGGFAAVLRAIGLEPSVSKTPTPRV